MMGVIDDHFGSIRGLGRVAIARFRHALGQYREVGTVDWSRVERLVPVCAGNICRSPFAEHWLRRHTEAVASFGLFTESGLPADATGQRAAMRLGLDLGAHRSTRREDYVPRRGDLLLLMEDRHIAPARAVADPVGAQLVLLGLWHRPVLPLIYDPHTLSEAYFVHCFSRIERALQALVEDWRRAGMPAATSGTA